MDKAVWMVCGSVDYEPGEVFGIYSTELQATAAEERMGQHGYYDGIFTIKMYLNEDEGVKV